MSAVCYECRLVKRTCHLWRNLMRWQALNWLSVSRVVSYEDTVQKSTRVASIICFFNSYLRNFNIPKFNSCILFWKKWDPAAALLCLYYKFCWDVCRLCEGRWPDKSRESRSQPLSMHNNRGLENSRCHDLLSHSIHWNTEPWREKNK